jgi:hypothetical protein
MFSTELDRDPARSERAHKCSECHKRGYELLSFGREIPADGRFWGSKSEDLCNKVSY